MARGPGDKLSKKKKKPVCKGEWVENQRIGLACGLLLKDTRYEGKADLFNTFNWMSEDEYSGIRLSFWTVGVDVWAQPKGSNWSACYRCTYPGKTELHKGAHHTRYKTPIQEGTIWRKHTVSCIGQTRKNMHIADTPDIDAYMRR